MSSLHDETSLDVVQMFLEACKRNPTPVLEKLLDDLAEKIVSDYSEGNMDIPGLDEVFIPGLEIVYLPIDLEEKLKKGEKF